MRTGSTILVVDDDQRMCRLVARYLRGEGYTVRTAETGEAMRQAVNEEVPDLVVLDLMLPDEDGFELARELRAHSDLGIVILSGRGETVDKVVGLEIGADDYVTKPFDRRELLARIRSVLRRREGVAQCGTGTGSVARFGDWVLDLDGHELRAESGETVPLTHQEFQLLASLVSHGHRVLTRETIMQSVFGRDWLPDDRGIDVLVGRLRGKLGDDARQPTIIRTVRGTGYQLIPTVRLTDAQAPPASPPT
jgi:DNA-binding response OmpR family regulator